MNYKTYHRLLSLRTRGVERITNAKFRLTENAVLAADNAGIEIRQAHKGNTLHAWTTGAKVPLCGRERSRGRAYHPLANACPECISAAFDLMDKK